MSRESFQEWPLASPESGRASGGAIQSSPPQTLRLPLLASLYAAYVERGLTRGEHRDSMQLRRHIQFTLLTKT